MSETPIPAASPVRPPTATAWSAGRHAATIALVAAVLVAGADWLLWGEQAGISLAILGTLVAAATLLTTRPRRLARQHLIGLSAAGLAMLPVVEYVQPLSVLIWSAGLIFMALMFDDRVAPVLWRNLHLFPAFPVVGLDRFVRDAAAGAHALRGVSERPERVLAAWAMPAALGAVFVLLFAAANPLIEAWVEALVDIDLPPTERVAFWALMLVLVWPFLRLAGCAWPVDRLPQVLRPVSLGPSRLVTELSVRNGLILFNVVFAVQTLLDAVYLWGGVALPEGMTYAEYAHRGAYPLIATALLAGAIVVFVTTFFRPDRLLRWLILLWIAQNVVLLGSSVLRLNLYVEVYSLTHLRIAAFIWMGLVGAGFLLLVARLAWDKSNGWLIATNAAVAGVTLYACCFVNFADVIARYNIAHSAPVMAGGRPLDEWYLCNLGPHALPAILDHQSATGGTFCGRSAKAQRARYHPAPSWRGWGLRDWRLERYLAAMDANEPRPIRHGR